MVYEIQYTSVVECEDTQEALIQQQRVSGRPQANHRSVAGSLLHTDQDDILHSRPKT